MNSQPPLRPLRRDICDGDDVWPDSLTDDELHENDAGFAYLPEGPDERLGNGGFEAPSFRRLRGDWYAWTASW